MEEIGQIVNKMTKQHEQLLGYLKHRPKRNAILNNALVSCTGLQERTIRRLVRELILVHRCPIGSSTQEGYYWISDPAEVQENYDRLRKRAIKILERAAAMKKIALSEVFDQLKLEV
jgi:hypothetical protein